MRTKWFNAFGSTSLRACTVSLSGGLLVTSVVLGCCCVFFFSVLKKDRPSDTDIPDEPRFTHSLRIVQHLHDRISPWRLNEILLNYLYNRGVAVLALHDGLDAQRAYAERHDKPFKPWSHFGDYRHDYEKVVPTLKYFSAATFFTSFLLPMTYEQLEA